MKSSATLSDDGLYRYDLIRGWDEGTTCAFIGLNPSTADALNDDPTIRRCIGFAKDWGHGRLVMLNAYAYRCTYPQGLLNVVDPIGPLNDQYLRYWLNKCEMVIAAWGTGINITRQKYLVKLFPDLHILKLTKHGFPAHPLYLRKDLVPIRWC